MREDGQRQRAHRRLRAAARDAVQRRQQQDQRIQRRAKEQQDRLQQLQPAHRREIRQAQQMKILHVARAPAFVAAQEFRHGRRVRFQAAILRRQAAHAPAGRLQAHAFHHVVGQDAAAIGQRLQPRMATEGLAAEDCVVAPIGAGITLPPGLPRSPAAHACAHAELEQAREGRRRGPPDDQLLHDGKIGLRFHDRDQAQHRIGRHDAVGVERDEERGIPGVMIQEVHHIAGLEAVIRRAAAIADGRGI